MELLKKIHTCTYGRIEVPAIPVKEDCYNRSRKGWKRVGYKVRKGQRPCAYYSKWNGMYYHNWPLFHFSQCEPILGKKAQQRRKEFETQSIEYAQQEGGLPF